MKNSWIKIRCSDTDLVVLRKVAELTGTDVSTFVHVTARREWRRLVKAAPLPVTEETVTARVSSKARRRSV
jgi:uncharacterized protein (DUF1778 family)